MIDTSRQNIALGIVVAFPILGGLSIILRLWSRYLKRSALSSGMEKPSGSTNTVCRGYIGC